MGLRARCVLQGFSGIQSPFTLECLDPGTLRLPCELHSQPDVFDHPVRAGDGLHHAAPWI